MSVGSAQDLNWLLETMVSTVADVRQAVVMSSDGLLMGGAGDLDRDSAERLAALAAGFQSLARSTGHQFEGGDVRQSIVEMDRAFLFVTAAGSGACLAVLTTATADMGLVAYEMAMLVKRVGRHLATAPRTAVDS
jgi:predicted regulator of Ras-like GTPase activity (Roadblock/LC7/MglB family)